MNAIQWGTPSITVEKVLDRDPKVHFMNLEDALQQKRYEDAITHLEYAWKVSYGKEGKKQCLQVLQVLHKIGYAKDIRWDREVKKNKFIYTILSIILCLILPQILKYMFNDAMIIFLEWCIIINTCIVVKSAVLAEKVDICMGPPTAVVLMIMGVVPYLLFNCFFDGLSIITYILWILGGIGYAIIGLGI